MKLIKNRSARLLSIVILLSAITGCSGINREIAREEIAAEIPFDGITLTSSLKEIAPDLQGIRIDVDSGISDLLAQGGASSEQELLVWLAQSLTAGVLPEDLLNSVFGCTSLHAAAPDHGFLFGRNFDWDSCSALIVEHHPVNGYSSITTVNTSFLFDHAPEAVRSLLEQERILAITALFSPLDGINEAGVAICVNMINDPGSAGTIDQNSEKPDLTVTSAIRAVLEKAGSAEEAVSLLSGIDLHSPEGMMVHFMIGDAQGNCIAVEYWNNTMAVAETDYLTNSWITPEAEEVSRDPDSAERFSMLEKAYEESPVFDHERMRGMLEQLRSSRNNQEKQTQWSVIMDCESQEITYYWKEDYSKPYRFRLEKDQK